MELDNQTIKDLANQLGIKAGEKQTFSEAKSYASKSDDELMKDILDMKDKLSKNNVSYEQQLSAIKSLIPMMNGEQKARLYEIIELLKSK